MSHSYKKANIFLIWPRFVVFRLTYKQIGLQVAITRQFMLCAVFIGNLHLQRLLCKKSRLTFHLSFWQTDRLDCKPHGQFAPSKKFGMIAFGFSKWWGKIKSIRNVLRLQVCKEYLLPQTCSSGLSNHLSYFSLYSVSHYFHLIQLGSSLLHTLSVVIRARSCIINV